MVPVNRARRRAGLKAVLSLFFAATVAPQSAIREQVERLPRSQFIKGLSRGSRYSALNRRKG